MDPFLYCLTYNVPGGRTSIDTNVALFEKRPACAGWAGLSLGVPCCHDKDLAFRVTAAGARLAYVDEELSVYRDHSGPRISTAPRNPAYPLDYFVGLLPEITRRDLYDLSGARSSALRELILTLTKQGYRAGEHELARQAFELVKILGRSDGVR